MKRLALLGVLLTLGACDPDNGGTDGDADVDGDGDADADPCPPDAECCSNTECSNGIYCDGMEICDRGRCDRGFPIECDDGLGCTEDTCDEMANLCVYVPDHDLCDDDDSCNGVERCDPAADDIDELGCLAGMPRVCDDQDDCTEDFCADDECQVRIRDADGDGHPDRNCAICDDGGECERGDDCDDLNETIYPGADEVCDDGQDNNCDRERDYADPGCTVPNDACADAIELVDGGWVHSSTRGTLSDIDRACGLASDRDVAFYFALGAESDVLFEIDSLGGSDLHVTLTADCGAPEGTFSCEQGRDFTMSARGLAPGTYFVVASAPADVDFAIRMTIAPAGPRPEGDLCSAPVSLAGDGVAVAGTLSGKAHDYTLSCADDEDPTLDTVYVIEVPTEQTADFSVTRTSGTGPISLAVQDTCGLSTAERACWTGDGEAGGRLWRLLPGTYYVLVAHADDVTFDLTATLSPLDPDLVFLEDFTGGSSGWTLAGAWERGTPSTFTEPDGDSGPCVATNVGGDYPDGMVYTSDYAQSPDIDLRGTTAPVLTFSSWLRAAMWEGDAGFRVELSVDGGAFSTARDVTPAYDGIDAWFGEHGAWESWEVDLSAHAGSVVTVRFAAYSTPWGWDRGAGWYVDDVLVIDR